MRPHFEILGGHEFREGAIQLTTPSQSPSSLTHPNTSQSQERERERGEFLLVVLISSSDIWAAGRLRDREGK